jgi:hypothetical protein
MTGMAPAACAPRMPSGESSSTTQRCGATPISSAALRKRSGYGLPRSTSSHKGIEAVKEPRATQVVFGRRTIGRCGERPRQSTLREVVHELDRAWLERNARAEELLQAIGELAPVLMHAKLRAEAILDQGKAFVVREPDHALIQVFRHIEALPCGGSDERPAVDALGVEQQAVHVQDHGVNGSGKGGHKRGVRTNSARSTGSFQTLEVTQASADDLRGKISNFASDDSARDDSAAQNAPWVLARGIANSRACSMKSLASDVIHRRAFRSFWVGPNLIARHQRASTACAGPLQQVENGVPIDQTRCDEFVLRHEFIWLVRHFKSAGPKDDSLRTD